MGLLSIFSAMPLAWLAVAKEAKKEADLAHIYWLRMGASATSKLSFKIKLMETLDIRNLL